MIIVKLNGGLGNQMFQYSLGRNLSVKHDVEFKLDISGFDSDNLRKYSLGVFNAPLAIATKQEVCKVRRENISPLLKKIQIMYESYLPYYKRSVVYENQFHFDENILNVRRNVYLDGYWQSEKYFKDFIPLIKKDFDLGFMSHSFNEKIIRKIENSQSVSIHLRRGDYVSNQTTSQVHGVLPISYYQKAIEIIVSKIPAPKFFIFSDDINWVKENFYCEYPMIFVEHTKDTESMYLMNSCAHNIIANSSFSWWGAWLNDKKNKFVVAPQKWFNNFNADTRDLYPESWIKI